MVSNLAKKEQNFVIETHSDFILERIGLEIKKDNLNKEEAVILFFEPTEPEVMVHPFTWEPMDRQPMRRRVIGNSS